MALKGAVPKPITVISYAPLLSLPLSKEAKVRREFSGEYKSAIPQRRFSSKTTRVCSDSLTNTHYISIKSILLVGCQHLDMFFKQSAVDLDY